MLAVSFDLGLSGGVQGLDGTEAVGTIFKNSQVSPPSPWYKFYKRVRLFPWWVRYNIGISKEAVLSKKIIEQAFILGLQDRWAHRVIQHAVSEFSKKGLGSDYYGYHNIHHELEATYVCLLAADGYINNIGDNKVTKDDISYLFTAALFHDYDPSKTSDKPHEDAVEWFIRNDPKIEKFIDAVGINLDIVIAMIHRTAFPFKGEIADHAGARMQELFTKAGISLDNYRKRKHYENLGWFLSVSERIAGYALGDFERAKELARRNAHALGWHPSLINEESVKYFSILKEEKSMLESVLNCIPEKYRQNFFSNLSAFRDLWEREVEIGSFLRKGKISLSSFLENTTQSDKYVSDSVLGIYRELYVPIRIHNEKKFVESLSHKDTILLTLRVKEDNQRIVGYAKGGPLEKYTLRNGTVDENYGKNNTVFMEWMSIKPGYWGHGGGHLLRTEFLIEAKKRGYSYLTSYVHRDVLLRRIEAGEKSSLVQKYDPDKLDYYRTDLAISNLAVPPQGTDTNLSKVEQMELDGKISALE